MNSSDFAISSSGLSKSFGKIQALKDVSINLPKGAVYALLGENGAGKTTLMRVLLGLFPPDNGAAEVIGKPIQTLKFQDFSKIAFVAESQIIPEWMWVREYLNYHSQFYPTWDKAYCESLCKNLELPLDQKLKNLSRGQRMKAMLVAAVSFKPELLVLDEPLSGLDPLVREELTSVIIDLVNQANSSVLISSHDIDDVEKCCDYTGFLLAGRLCVESEVSALQSKTKLVRVHFQPTKSELNLPSKWTLKSNSDAGLEAYVEDFNQGEIESFVRSLGTDARFEIVSLSLKEVFLFHLRRTRKQRIGG